MKLYTGWCQFLKFRCQAGHANNNLIASGFLEPLLPLPASAATCLSSCVSISRLGRACVLTTLGPGTWGRRAAHLTPDTFIGLASRPPAEEVHKTSKKSLSFI